jgi:predicted dehydrogenase
LILKRRIDAGEIGEINSAQSKWIRRTGIPGFGGWFTTKSLAGGGATIDLLHMIDLTLYFMGYPKPTNVLGKTFDTFMGDTRFKGPWGIPDRADGVTDVEAAAHGFRDLRNRTSSYSSGFLGRDGQKGRGLSSIPGNKSWWQS